MNFMNSYDQIKDGLNSLNDHPLVVGHVSLKPDVIKLVKIEFEPFTIRWDKCVFVEPYEFGYEEDKIQVECITLCSDSFDIEVKSNIKTPQNNFVIRNIIDIHMEKDYYVCRDIYGNLHTIREEYFRFMDGKTILGGLANESSSRKIN